MAKEELEAFVAKYDIKLACQFVPFSRSRNQGAEYPSLNWKVTVNKADRDILTTDYMAGCAHAPSYKQLRTKDSDKAVREECESGKSVRYPRKPILPKVIDVLYSLASDAGVLDSSSFEDWASDFGYDVDSRKAELIYRACLEIALALRNGLGDTVLKELQEACQDY
jgi:hypothetical protein